jgi:FkbM family methyltransferase
VKELLTIIRGCRPNFEPRVIFDIGANDGKFAKRLAVAFPFAELYAFEPGAEAYRRLSLNLKDAGRKVHLENIALDKETGEALFTSTHGMGNHIVYTAEASEDTHLVRKTRGDEFCAERGIPSIDLLKIDTEGYDLDCLCGFANMLLKGAIDMIEVETTSNLDNRFHVHLERFIHFLHPFNYRLTSLHDFTRIIHRTKQVMNGAWFCNALFVREIDQPALRRDGKN